MQPRRDSRELRKTDEGMHAYSRLVVAHSSRASRGRRQMHVHHYTLHLAMLLTDAMLSTW